MRHHQGDAADGAFGIGGPPVILRPTRVLGPLLPEPWRWALDLPAYWLVLLVVEFPVIVAGAAFLWRSRGRPGGSDGGGSEGDEAGGALARRALAVLGAVSLLGGWLLVSTAGENNDLGWRAILPAILLLTVMAAGGAAGWAARRPGLSGIVMALVIAAGLPDAFRVGRGNLTGDPSASAAAFAEAPALWEAVRRHAGPDQRVANNPGSLGDVTPWAVNIGWALLADRRSCFAGNEMALAFAFLPAGRRLSISDRFARVFRGEASPDDLAALADAYGCEVVVVTPRDGAWAADPFGASARFRLLEAMPDRWRIYGRHPRPS